MENSVVEKTGMVLGIDEVRKVESIGPMVLCGALVPEQDFKNLYENKGVRDSKRIKNKIDKLGKYLKRKYNNTIFKITAEEISKDHNINVLESSYVLRLVEKYYGKVDKIYIDSIGPEPEFLFKYETKLNKYKDKMIVECHADGNYVPVMVASIIAKYHANAENIYLNNKFGAGSGSPSDPDSLRYIIENLDNKHNIIRTNWKTYTRLKDNEKLRNILLDLINSNNFNLIKLKEIYKNA